MAPSKGPQPQRVRYFLIYVDTRTLLGVAGFGTEVPGHRQVQLMLNLIVRPPLVETENM